MDLKYLSRRKIKVVGWGGGGGKGGGGGEGGGGGMSSRQCKRVEEKGELKLEFESISCASGLSLSAQGAWGQTVRC